jgi:exopolysaccharide production protein ExoY
MTVPFQPDTVQLMAAKPVRLDRSNDLGLYAMGGKRLFDTLFVLLLLPIALPLIAFFALILKAQGFTPFYVQKRIGKGGRVFHLLKLRTMYPGADAILQNLLATDPVRRAEWDSTQKLKDDPRITPVGRILRKTSIDELPQLLNVLLGDMSLLGPRPMMVNQASLYGPTLPDYMAVRPGISGLWQVTERNESDFRRRAQIDSEYVRSLSFGRDLVLVLKTARAVLRSTGY